MNGDVTAMDINCALASRYRRDGDGYWSEISVTEPNDTVLRLDGVALEVNWRGDTWISGFEVKVSRGDFLRDAKYLCYKNYVDDLTLPHDRPQRGARAGWPHVLRPVQTHVEIPAQTQPKSW